MMRPLLIALFLAGCTTSVRAPALDPIALSRSMTGCWVGQRSDGRTEVLRIEPREWGTEFLSAAGKGVACPDARPFVGLEREETAVVAYSRLPAQYYVWTVSATPDVILLTPANAPVWLRVKRVEAGLEWSTGGHTAPGRPYVDATILSRAGHP